MHKAPTPINTSSERHHNTDETHSYPSRCSNTAPSNSISKCQFREDKIREADTNRGKQDWAEDENAARLPGRHQDALAKEPEEFWVVVTHRSVQPEGRRESRRTSDRKSGEDRHPDQRLQLLPAAWLLRVHGRLLASISSSKQFPTMTALLAHCDQIII